MLLRRVSRQAFTLLDFLMILMVIAILLALLLPAINAAREAARQSQCQNNLKQLTLGVSDARKRAGPYADGGWGAAGLAIVISASVSLSPVDGCTTHCPSWNLPHFMIWARKSPPPGEKMRSSEIGQSRRRSPYCTAHAAAALAFRGSIPGRSSTRACPRSRIAATTRPTRRRLHQPRRSVSPHWQSLRRAAIPAGHFGRRRRQGLRDQSANAKATFKAVADAANGVIFAAAMIGFRDITTARPTPTAGREVRQSDYYATGEDPATTPPRWLGDNQNVSRWTFLPPLEDTAGYLAPWQFGSVHPRGVQNGLCDGSVRQIDYTIDPDSTTPSESQGQQTRAVDILQ